MVNERAEAAWQQVFWMTVVLSYVAFAATTLKTKGYADGKTV
jgi:hypothetical protein